MNNSFNPLSYLCRSLRIGSALLSGLTMSYADIVPAPDTGWINVASNGAIPNDGIDDTAAIQQLIRENIAGVQAGTGVRTLYFPEGVYNISDTLKWKNNQDQWKAYLIFQGQGRDKTILRLKDNTFTNPSSPQAVIFTASSKGGDLNEKEDGVGNTAFYNVIRDLTVDTGIGNTGAIGIDYLNSNMGAIRNVRVISSDPNRVGVTGISMARDWPGPALLKNVEVIGFDRGMDFFEQTTYLTTMEEIYLSEQHVVGIRNNAHPLAIRKLYSTNTVPVLKSQDSSNRDSALTVIIEGRFSGGGASAYAIEYEMGLYLRDIEIEGYRDLPVRDNNNFVDTGSRMIAEYVSHAAYSEFDSPPRSLHLPIEETPEAPNDPIAEWVKVDGFFSANFQAAVDRANTEGKSTIYLPFGKYFFSTPVTISGSIRRIVGNGSQFFYRASTSDFRAFVLRDLDGPDLTFENFVTMDNMLPGAFTWISDESPTTVVLKDIMSQSDGVHYRNTVPTKVFIENVAFGSTTFTNAQVWARGFDPEDRDISKIINEGSDLWILGLKTEWPSTVLENRNGARTELLGTFFYPPINPRNGGIAILNDESQLSFVGVNHGVPNRIQVRDIRGGETRDYTISDSSSAGHPKNGLITPLYTSYAGAIPIAPSNVQAVRQENGHVLLQWTDNSTDETGFIVERRLLNGSWEIIAQAIAPNATSYLDEQASPFSSYEYRVLSVNESVRSNPSNLTVSVGKTATSWNGFDVDENGWANTGDWLGYINVQYSPWIWVSDRHLYAYFYEDTGWLYFIP